MDEHTYVDLEVLASVNEDDYLVRISKKDFNRLVDFDENLIIRHWDGEQPVSLEAYGTDAIRTDGDTTKDNNLSPFKRPSSV